MSVVRLHQKKSSRTGPFLARIRETVETHPAYWFLLLSLLTLLVYWFGLIRPYNLLSNYQEPLLNASTLTLHRPLAEARLGFTFATLFALYFLLWRLCRNINGKNRTMISVFWASVIAINLAMLWLYPIGAADIFDNIMRGRITAQHHGNPFYESPAIYSQDPFYAYSGWKQFTTAYGPLWELLSAITSWLTGDDILVNILAFKLLGMIFYLGAIKLIATTLEKYAPERTLQGLCLFALNPLLIYETAGNGHNDILMTFFILLALVTLLNNRFILSTLSLTAGALVKFIPIMLLPVALVAGIHAQPSKRQRWRFMTFTALACTALIILLNAPFWQGGDPFNLTFRSNLFTTSLPALIQAQLEPSLGKSQSEHFVASAALFLTVVVIVLSTLYAWRKYIKEKNDLPRITSVQRSFWVFPVRIWTFQLIIYLLFTCLWFQPWYVIWPLSLAAILPEGGLVRLIVLLSGAVSFKTIIFNLLLPLDGSLPPKSWRETILGPAILGIAWLYATYLGARSLWRHRHLTRQEPSGV